MRNVNLGELLDLFTNIKVGTKEAIQNDILGRIYEYFLGQFAKKELQKVKDDFAKGKIESIQEEVSKIQNILQSNIL